MNHGRRNLLLSTLFGTGWLGLRALATGLPVSLLANPREARADDPACSTKPQYLAFFTSSSGDPLNANVPGCYTDAGIYHPAAATMAPTAMTLGGRSYMAARPWAQLPANVLARTCFFHHGTYTNAHGDASKVNRLMGAVQRQEMLVSLIAKSVAPCLKTIQTNPVVLSDNLITCNGAVLPVLRPSNLRAVLTSPTGPLAKLQQIRDTHLDQLNALYKQSGNPSQRALLDQYALSQTEARSLSQQLLDDLGAINGTPRLDVNVAMAVLFKMNVSPVVVARYDFGGDNHTDANLANETTQTVASVAAIEDLLTRLHSYGLDDAVTIGFQHVFGRSLSVAAHSGNADGRNHNANHHCSVLIGSRIKGSVIGGVAPTTNRLDYRATGIDSATGRSTDAGDVKYEETLGAVGKTLAAAVGLAPAVFDDQITEGKAVKAALA